MTTPTPDSVYEQLWKPLVEKDGTLDPELVKQLLFDYGYLLLDTEILYSYLTEGQITNPQDSVDDVIEIADQLAADSIDLGIRAVLNELLVELDRTSARTPEERLEILTHTINSIYEQGNATD